LFIASANLDDIFFIPNKSQRKNNKIFKQ
jgi:hypothetical protein